MRVFGQGLLTSLQATLHIKGLLEMMFDVLSGWIDEFISDMEVGPATQFVKQTMTVFSWEERGTALCEMKPASFWEAIHTHACKHCTSAGGAGAAAVHATIWMGKEGSKCSESLECRDQDVETTTEVPGTPPGTRPTTPPSASPGPTVHTTPPPIPSHITPGQLALTPQHVQYTLRTTRLLWGFPVGLVPLATLINNSTFTCRTTEQIGPPEYCLLSLTTHLVLPVSL